MLTIVFILFSLEISVRLHEPQSNADGAAVTVGARAGVAMRAKVIGK